MSVIKLVLAYDGTEFHGWARQPGVRTIGGLLEEALGRLLPEPPRLSVARRTDAGVHAEGQVASFEAPEDLEPERATSPRCGRRRSCSRESTTSLPAAGPQRRPRAPYAFFAGWP